VKATSSVRGVLVAGMGVASLTLAAPPAHADGGWVAAANSPSHEQMDWAWGTDLGQATAESRALAHCVELERASDCQLLASGPDCVAIAWDGDQPINHAHGRSGGGPEVVVQAAIAAAGPHANNPEVRCSWYPHS